LSLILNNNYGIIIVGNNYIYKPLERGINNMNSINPFIADSSKQNVVNTLQKLKGNKAYFQDRKTKVLDTAGVKKGLLITGIALGVIAAAAACFLIPGGAIAVTAGLAAVGGISVIGVPIALTKAIKAINNKRNEELAKIHDEHMVHTSLIFKEYHKDNRQINKGKFQFVDKAGTGNPFGVKGNRSDRDKVRDALGAIHNLQVDAKADAKSAKDSAFIKKAFLIMGLGALFIGLAVASLMIPGGALLVGLGLGASVVLTSLAGFGVGKAFQAINKARDSELEITHQSFVKNAHKILDASPDVDLSKVGVVNENAELHTPAETVSADDTTEEENPFLNPSALARARAERARSI